MVSYERLREVLDYDPYLGIFIWKNKTAKNIIIGSIAGGKRPSDGYWRIGIDGERYVSHRLAWLYMTGAQPPEYIDHVDNNRANNRWDNLRATTWTQNLRNMKMHKDNATGLKGVSYDKRHLKWYGQIKHDGKKHFLGYFDCPAAASFAYQIEADKHFGEFSRWR